jgi:hypothetical protein
MKMDSTPRRVAAVAILVATTGGCATKAEQRAEDGLAAFKVCDLRSASKAFDDAHGLDPSRADFALAYALSTLAVLPEDPAVTSVLERLGFNGPIDTSSLWGKGGAIDQLSAGTSTCQSVGDYVRSKLPYAAAQSDGPSAASLVRDPTLSGDDFVAAAAALDPRLEKVVAALEQAAGGAGDTDIEGGCGVGKVHIEAPELYGLASLIEAVRATIHAAQGYDWSVPATLVLDDSGHEQAYVDALNAHVLHVRSAAGVSGAGPIAIHAVELFQQALAAAARVTSRPANSLFDWTKMPAGAMADLKTLADAAHLMLSTPGLQTFPFYSPALAMDGRSFLGMPVDMTNVQPPIWSAVPQVDSLGNHWVEIETTSTGIDAQLSPRFSPYPFAKDAPGVTFTLPDRWKGITSDMWLAAFDPDRRWDAAYRCSN